MVKFKINQLFKDESMNKSTTRLIESKIRESRREMENMLASFLATSISMRNHYDIIAGQILKGEFDSARNLLNGSKFIVPLQKG